MAQRPVNMAREAARPLKVELVERPVASAEELRAATAKRLPTVFQDRKSVQKGALIGYGESHHTIGRRSAKHVHQVLLGANLGDLPVD